MMPTIELDKKEFRVVMAAMEAYVLIARSIMMTEPVVLNNLKDKLWEAIDDAESE